MSPSRTTKASERYSEWTIAHARTQPYLGGRESDASVGQSLDSWIGADRGAQQGAANTQRGSHDELAIQKMTVQQRKG